MLFSGEARSLTFDADDLDHMQHQEQREEGVAVDIKGIAELNALLHVLRHGWGFKKAIGKGPKRKPLVNYAIDPQEGQQGR